MRKTTSVPPSGQSFPNSIIFLDNTHIQELFESFPLPWKGFFQIFFTIKFDHPLLIILERAELGDTLPYFQPMRFVAQLVAFAMVGTAWPTL